jgi:hypothetical protein
MAHHVLARLIGRTHQAALNEMRVSTTAPGATTFTLISGWSYHAD